MSSAYSLERAARLREEILSAERVLCVQPHHDDNDIGAGGTFALLADRGVELHYLTVTDNLAGVSDPSLTDDEALSRLARERGHAGSEIGVRSWHDLGLPDAGDWDEVALRGSLIERIRVLRPDFVFTCDPWLPHEAHRDHLRTGILTAEAVMFHGLPRFRTRPEVDRDYFAKGVPRGPRGLVLYYTVEENVVFDVAPGLARKHRAIACYPSLIAGAALEAVKRGVSRFERQLGEAEGFAHAEGFKLLRPGQLHVGLGRPA